MLNEGTDALIETLEQLQRENMEGDIERFVAALAADHITPFDFYGPPAHERHGI